ncbi:shikimate kinase [Flavobacteriaceae sp. LMIT009]
MVIVLMGYMASGKSTIGNFLAKKLDFEFLDLDDYIEIQEGLTVKQIFSDKGEIYFRKLETRYLIKLLETEENIVLALGGGTPCYGNNLESILKNGNTISVYLKASINSIIKRVEGEKSKRPLIAHLNTKEDIIEFIGKHLFERSQFYNQADFVVGTDNLEIDQIIEQIILKLY